MKFMPKTEEQIIAERLWPIGIYPFEIFDGEDTVSKEGNDMIKLKVQIFNQEGDSIVVFDYLLEAMAHKLRHCAEVCGLLDKYQIGELCAADFVGKTGSAKIFIKKDKTGQFQDSNAIADYIVQKQNTQPAKEPPPTPSRGVLDDEIPF